MLRILRAYAGTFVALSWVFLAFAIPICVGIIGGNAICAFYGPTLRDAPFCIYDGRAAEFAVVASAIAGVASSIALLLKFRLAASLFVVGIWSAILLGVPGARLFVQSGPEYFIRHLGEQKFKIPWQYEPSHVMGSTEEDSTAFGFNFQLCESGFKGAQDPDCVGRHTEVRVFPKKANLTNLGIDQSPLRKNLPQMRLEPDRDGYQSYAYDVAPPPGSTVAPEVTHYYVRRNSEGQITRFVVCRSEPICDQGAVVSDYVLSYAAALDDAEMMQAKLMRLIDSWRVD
jgi:hypothetical protein